MPLLSNLTFCVSFDLTFISYLLAWLNFSLDCSTILDKSEILFPGNEHAIFVRLANKLYWCKSLLLISPNSWRDVTL